MKNKLALLFFTLFFAIFIGCGTGSVLESRGVDPITTVLVAGIIFVAFLVGGVLVILGKGCGARKKNGAGSKE